jgi:hypothetical protein
MREITFEVTLRFSSKITSDEQIKEVQQNVLNALINQADTAGLSPEMGDAFTTDIKVFEPFTQVILIRG